MSRCLYLEYGGACSCGACRKAARSALLKAEAVRNVLRDSLNRIADLEAALTWATWIGSGTPARGITEERYRELIAEAAANHRAREPQP